MIIIDRFVRTVAVIKQSGVFEKSVALFKTLKVSTLQKSSQFQSSQVIEASLGRDRGNLN